MTREGARKAAEIMLAYADGAEIEYTIKGMDIWKKSDRPTFNWYRYKYRIKSKQVELDPKISQALDNALERRSMTPEDVLSTIKLAYASGVEIRVSLMDFLNEKKCSVKPKSEKFDPKTLQPFDKVLARDNDNEKWACNLFSHITDGKEFPYMCGTLYKMVVPYNKDTKHLVGTTDEAPEFYRYWEE